MKGQPTSRYTIEPDPVNPSEYVVIVDPDGKKWRIDKESADPEHRYTSYRLAAGWFGNLPAGCKP